jgi:hypothetical protein
MVTSDPMLDWLTAVLGAATLVMAGATIYLGRQTRDAVRVGAKTAEAAQAEADATLALVGEARRDRELAVQPVLVAVRIERADATPVLQIRNIGPGPAVGIRVLHRTGGEVFWTARLFHLSSGETYPSDAALFPLQERRGAAWVQAAFVGEQPPEDICAYCVDQLGNALRFRLRTGEPTQVWRPGTTPPLWAAVLSDPLDWRSLTLRTEEGRSAETGEEHV